MRLIHPRKFLLVSGSSAIAECDLSGPVHGTRTKISQEITLAYSSSRISSGPNVVYVDEQSRKEVGWR
jgi:hypothetical protein